MQRKFSFKANDEFFSVKCQNKRVGNLYRRIIEGLKEYETSVIDKSDKNLVEFLKKKIASIGYKILDYLVLFDIVDLYHDIDLKKKCIHYRGTCIQKVGTSQIVELDNGTYVLPYLEDCFELIDRDWGF